MNWIIYESQLSHKNEDGQTISERIGKKDPNGIKLQSYPLKVDIGKRDHVKMLSTMGI